MNIHDHITNNSSWLEPTYPSILMRHYQFWSAMAKSGVAFTYLVVCLRVMSNGSEDEVLCCGDSEVFSTPPRFSTIRLNILDKESDNIEDDLKDYLKKVSYMSGWKVHC